MPESSIEQILSRATAEVLETMFFTGFVAEGDRMPEGDTPIAATLAFDGERRGMLALAISAGAAHTLATDFLGVESEHGPNDEQVNEVVRELANMICGDALSALEKKALCLSPPEIVPLSDVVTSLGGRSRSFDLGNGWLTVALVLQHPDD